MLAMENKMRFMETCTIYICAPPRNGKKRKAKDKIMQLIWGEGSDLLCESNFFKKFPYFLPSLKLSVSIDFLDFHLK